MAKIFHVVNLKNEYYGLTWNSYSWLQRRKENVPLLPFFPTIKINTKTKWRLGRIHWCPRNVEKSRCKPLVSRYVCGIVSGWRGHFGCDFPPLDQQLLVLWQYVYFFFKMLHYFAKDFYAPVIASPYVNGKKFQVFVISDLTKVLCHHLFPSVPSLKKKTCRCS